MCFAPPLRSTSTYLHSSQPAKSKFDKRTKAARECIKTSFDQLAKKKIATEIHVSIRLCEHETRDCKPDIEREGQGSGYR